jgi:hypothetical protein
LRIAGRLCAAVAGLAPGGQIRACSSGWLVLRVLESAVVLDEALEQRDKLVGFGCAQRGEEGVLGLPDLGIKAAQAASS